MKSLTLKRPIIYKISAGTAHDEEDTVYEAKILSLIRSAVEARFSAVQIREKHLSARSLYELCRKAAAIIANSETELLINDRADIASACGADGVHLRADSIGAKHIRSKFGEKFRVAVSTHSLAEAEAAKNDGADFIVFGPIFESYSDAAPKGIDSLAKVVEALGSFPVVALGGINERNFAECFRAGAAGIAGIRVFEDAQAFREIAAAIRSEFS